jgi:hypothetical protein
VADSVVFVLGGEAQSILDLIFYPNLVWNRTTSVDRSVFVLRLYSRSVNGSDSAVLMLVVVLAGYGT